MNSNFTKHRQQYLYVQSKASQWSSPSLEMGVLPPGMPFHPESRGCCAEQGLLWAVLAAMIILASSAACWQSAPGPRGRQWVCRWHLCHARARCCAVLCPWLRMVIILEFASISRQQWGMRKAVLYSACTCCLMLYGVIVRLWFALQYSVLEFGL